MSAEWGAGTGGERNQVFQGGTLSEQATLRDFTTIKNAKHTSFNRDPNYHGVLGVNDFPLLQHRGITTQLWGGTKGSSGAVEPRLSGELGDLKSTSHERVTSSLWTPPPYHPLPASAPVTQLISISSVQLLPRRSWAPGRPLSGQALHPRPCPLSPPRKYLEDLVCSPSGAQHSARQADSRCSPLFFV